MSSERKVAVITGASQGMGAALVEAYRDRDYGVVATARSIRPTNDDQILAVPGDITDRRGALPAQAVFFIRSERDGFHAGEPANDGRFIAVFAHALEHTGGYAPEEARRTAGTLLPDMLSYDPTRPASFPSNGRTLTDDAADAFLAVLTNGKVTGDKVGPHIDLLAEFPYLGPPHSISVPSHATSPIATELRKASRRLGSS